MEFNVIGFENKELWEETTKNSEVYYEWQYVDAFLENGDGIPKLAYAKKDENIVLYVFFMRSIANDLKLDNKYDYYDIISPYGYGGVYTNKLDKDLMDFFFKKFTEYCQNNKIVSEFIRLNPLLDNYKYYDDSYQILNISKTIYMKLDSEEEIWSNMESRCRNTIRKAQKNNLVVKSGFNEERFNEFIKIYEETMKRDNANEYYFFKKSFYESMLKNMANYAKIYTVYYESKPISSSIVIYDGKNANYHLSGTLSNYMNLGANNLVLYQISLDLLHMGITKFHLGGGYGGDDSPLFKFKKSFNKFGELDFYIGKKIYDKKIYDELCQIRNINQNESFFPSYRKE